MWMKFFYLCFLLKIITSQLLSERIELLNMKKEECSSNLGKIDLVLNSDYLSEEEIKSYFILNFKDKKNKKRPMICLASFSGQHNKNNKLIEDEEECDFTLNEFKNKLDDAIKETNLEPFAQKLKNIGETMEKDELSDDFKKLFSSLLKLNGYLKDAIKKSEISEKIQKIIDDYNLKEISDTSKEINSEISNILSKIFKTSVNKSQLENELNKVKFSIHQIQKIIQDIKSLKKLSAFISKLKIFDDSIQKTPDGVKLFFIKEVYRQIRFFLTNFDITKIKENLKNVEIPDELKEHVSKLDTFGLISDTLKKIFSSDNVKEIENSRKELCDILDNLITNYTANTTLAPFIEKIQDIMKKIGENVNTTETIEKFLEFSDNVKKLNETVSETMDKMKISNQAKLLSDIKEYIKNVEFAKIKDKINEASNNEFVEKLKSIFQSKNLDEFIQRNEELKDMIKEYQKNKSENSKLKKLVEKLKEITKKIDDKLQGVEAIGDFKTLISTINDYNKKFKNIVDKINDNAPNDVKESLNNEFNSLKDKLNQTIANFTNNAKGKMNNSEEYQEINKKVKDILFNSSNLNDAINKSKELKEYISDLQKKEKFNNPLGNFIKIIKEKMEKIDGSIKDKLKDNEIYKDLKEYGDTLKELDSNLKDLFNEETAPKLNNSLSKIKESIDNLKEIDLEPIKEILNDYISNLDGNIKNTFEQLKKTDFYSKLEKLKNMTQSNSNSTSSLNDIMAKIKKLDIDSFDEKLINISEQVKNSIKNSDLFKDLQKYTIEFLTLNDKLKNISNDSENQELLKQQILKLWEELKDLNAETLKSNITTAYDNLKKNIQELIGRYINKVNETIKENEPLIREIAKLINTKTGIADYPLLNATANQVLDDLINLDLNKLESSLTNFSDAAGLKLGDLLKSMGVDINIEGIKKDLGNYTKAFKEFGNGVKQIYEDSPVSEKVETAVDKVKKYLKEKNVTNLSINDIENKFKDMINNFKNSSGNDNTSFISKIKNSIEKIKNNNSTSFSDALSKVISELSDIKSDILKYANVFNDSFIKLDKITNDLKIDNKEYLNNIKLSIKKIIEDLQNGNMDNLKEDLKAMDFLGIMDKLSEFNDKQKNSKIALVKEKIDLLIKSKNLKEALEAAKELKDALVELSKEISENPEFQKFVDKIKENTNKILEKYKDSETVKGILEYNSTLFEFNNKVKELLEKLKGHSLSDTYDDIKNVLGDMKNDGKDMLLNFTDTAIEKLDYQDLELINQKFKDIFNSKSLEELIENSKEFKNLLKNLTSKYVKDTKLEPVFNKLNEIDNKIKEKINKLFINEFFSSFNNLYEQLKNDRKKIKLITLNETLLKLKESMENLPDKLNDSLQIMYNSFPNLIDFIYKVEDILNETDVNLIMKCVQMKLDTNISDNEKRVLSHKKNYILRNLESKYLTCKIDDLPNEDVELNPELQNVNILNNNTYNLTLSENLNITLENKLSNNCSGESIKELKDQISFKNFSDLEIQKSEKRIKYKIKISIKKTYKPPNFFYLKINTRVRYKTTLLRNIDEEEDVDTFCIPGEETDLTKEETELECYSLVDNPENIIGVGNFSSNYIDIPENITLLNINDDPINSDVTSDSTEKNNNQTQKPNTPNNTQSFYRYNRSKSKKLSSGEIVGIVLGSIAALILLIVLFIVVRKQLNKSKVIPMDKNMTESNIAMKI